MFSDQDDVWFEKKVELLCHKLFSKERIYGDIPLIVFSDAVVTDQELRILSASRESYVKGSPSIAQSYNLLSIHGAVPGCAMICNKIAYLNAFPLPQFTISHDTWIALIAVRNGKIFFYNKSTIFYRRHAKNVSNAQKSSILNLLKRISVSKILHHYRIARNVHQHFNEKFSFFAYWKNILHILILRLVSHTVFDVKRKNVDWNIE